MENILLNKLKIYFYNVGYHSYEECPTITICSYIYFSEDEFDRLVYSCIKDIKEKYEDFGLGRN